MSLSSDAGNPECCFCPLENKKTESPKYDLSLCPHCNEVFYCSEEHFRLHRSHDGSQCLPFRLIQTKDRGRIVVATRSLPLSRCETITCATLWMEGRFQAPWIDWWSASTENWLVRKLLICLFESWTIPLHQMAWTYIGGNDWPHRHVVQKEIRGKSDQQRRIQSHCGQVSWLHQAGN